MFFKKKIHCEAYGQQELQEMMMTIFPEVNSLVVNSVAQDLSYKAPGHPVLNFLIVGDHDKLRPFIIDPEASVRTRTAAYSSPNQYGQGKDLVIRFEFAHPEGIMIFETVLVGDDPAWLRRYVRALKKTDNFTVWIADDKKNVLKTLRVSWNYKLHKQILKACKRGK